MDGQSQDYAAASTTAAYAQQRRQTTNMQRQLPFVIFMANINNILHLFQVSLSYRQCYATVPLSPPYAAATTTSSTSSTPPHPHLLHLQQQQQPPPAFAPHLPPPMGPSPFHGPYDSAPPPPVPPPSDPKLQKRIDKLVEYIIKNGPEFESMIREKQQDNPTYGFLFGGEGKGYYRYKLWLMTRPHLGEPFNSPFPSSSVAMLHPRPNPVTSPPPPCFSVECFCINNWGSSNA
ncbi:hypothetical protein IC582_007125 [Cucumis melo]